MLTISELGGVDWATVSGDLGDAESAVRARWAHGIGAGAYEVLSDGRRIAIVRPAPTRGDHWACAVQLVEE